MIAKIPFIFVVNLPKIDAGVNMPFMIRAILVIAFVIAPKTPTLAPAVAAAPTDVARAAVAAWEPNNAVDSANFQEALKVFNDAPSPLKGFRFLI